MTLKDILWTLTSHTKVHLEVELETSSEVLEFDKEAWELCCLFEEEHTEFLQYVINYIHINTYDDLFENVEIVAYKGD